MKKLISIFSALLVACVLMASPALATDKIVKSTIDSATTAIDKNGNEYVRIIINETRKLEGVSYEVGVPVMVFGQAVSKAKSLKAGDQLNCIVASREYRGATSYTLRAFLNTKSTKK